MTDLNAKRAELYLVAHHNWAGLTDEDYLMSTGEKRRSWDEIQEWERDEVRWTVDRVLDAAVKLLGEESAKDTLEDLFGERPTDAELKSIAAAWDKHRAEAPEPQAPGEPRAEITAIESARELARWARGQTSADEIYASKVRELGQVLLDVIDFYQDQKPKPGEPRECDCGFGRAGHVGEHLSGCPAESMGAEFPENEATDVWADSDAEKGTLKEFMLGARWMFERMKGGR